MAIRRAPFEAFGLYVEPEAFRRLVDEAVRAFVPARPPVAAGADLNEREVAALHEAGLSFERRAMGADSPVARTAAEYAALLATALAVPQAAERLGVEPSRVRQRLLDHTLYGVRLKAGWRLPLFQFAEHGTIPHWSTVAPRLSGLHPVVVARWLLWPHVDLVVGPDEQAVSPRVWLEAGHDPARVAALADELRGGG